MATKLGKGEYPSGHGPDDFVCFGPPAVKDGEFDSVYLADLGCFNQQGVDSNKYYHGCVCQSKKDQTWYSYFEWGRTGKSGDVQFTECSSKEEAHSVFVKQMHDKNDKRGEWASIAGLQILRAKPGKDCYLVRPQAKRTVGLPDAQKLVHDESSKRLIASKASSGGGTALAVAEPKTKKKVKAAVSKWDAPTLQLLKDMNAIAVDFTRKSIEGGAIPMLIVLDEGRDILIAAKKRLLKVGRELDDQLADQELRTLSYALYSRIGKPKRVGAPDSEWILSEQNIDRWELDLDAFENANKAIELGAEDENEKEYDPFGGVDINMIHMTDQTREGSFLAGWMPGATKNVHGSVGDMRIHNMWAIRQNYNQPLFEKAVDRIATEKFRISEKPLFQPKREDLDAETRKRYEKANVAMLFHGTRSVNVPGIIRTGLRMPKELVGVVISGAMFGPGIYWADDWKKSDGYTSREGGYWSGGGGGVRNRKAFMFVANVAVGNPHVADGPSGYTSPPKGHHSVFGKAGHSRIHNNEWIIFDKGQNTLAYLVEYDTKRGW